MAVESSSQKSSSASFHSEPCGDKAELDLPTVTDVWGCSRTSNTEDKTAPTETDGESCQFSCAPSNDDRTEHVEGIQAALSERPGGVMEDTLDHFGKYLASILRQLPTTKSYHLQQKFINEAIEAKLLSVTQHPSEPLCPSGYQPAKVSAADVTAPQGNTTVDCSNPDTRLTASKNEPISEVNIKMEVPDEMEISDDTTHIDVFDRVTQDNVPHIEVEEERELHNEKSKISPFEVVYCDYSKKIKEGENENRLVSSVRQSSSSHASQGKQERGFACSLCSEVPSSSQELISHIKIKHPAVKFRHPRCSYCPVRKNRFTPHRCHNCSRSICKEHTGSVQYKCNKCSTVEAE